MMAFLTRLLAADVRPVTHNDVTPAAGDPDKEREIKQAQADLAVAIVDMERKSWEVRQSLARNTLKIVAGGKA